MFFYLDVIMTPPPHFPKKSTPKETKVKKDIQFCDKASEENSCKKNSSCKKDCDKIFSEKENEEKCQALPTNTVKAFKTLTQQTKDKDEIQEIAPKTLGCFLQIDPEEFADLIKTASRQTTKNFLVAIAESKALAEALENKDSDFDVLEELFEKAVGGKNLHRVLTRSIEDGKTFLQIAEEEESNQPAFYYLDNYVDLRCEDEDNFCGDKEESLTAYCKALVRLSDNNLEDFLDNAKHFEEEYSGEVKDAGFDYDEEGFRDFCSDDDRGSSSGSGSSSGTGSTPTPVTPCPNSNPPSEQKLAEITFYHHADQPSLQRYEYRPARFFIDTNVLGGSDIRGSSTPSTINVLPGILTRTDRPQWTQVWLKISAIPGFDFSNNTWYIYIAGTRYTLTRSSPSYTGGGDTYQKFSTSNNIVISDTNSKVIHLAYQPSGGSCVYITQP